jgi:hypothetical protein
LTQLAACAVYSAKSGSAIQLQIPLFGMGHAFKNARHEQQGEEMSKKLLTAVFAMVVGFAVIAIDGASLDQRKDPSTLFGQPAASNGAFRDGIYLGKLDAAQGRDPHLGVGRWSGDQDRIAFTSGYQQSYAAALEQLAKK